MDWHERIDANPAIGHGRPCIKGTRVLVATILDNLAGGIAPAAILASYPSLQPEDIQAALSYAAELSRERFVPLPAAV